MFEKINNLPKIIIISLAIFLSLPLAVPTFAAPLTNNNHRLLAQNDDSTLNFREEAIDQELPGTENVIEDDQSAGFSFWFSRFLTIALVIAVLLVFVNFILGAFKWITSGGDSGKVQEAQKQMTQSIIGLIVLAATVAVFGLLSDFLGIEILTFN